MNEQTASQSHLHLLLTIASCAHDNEVMSLIFQNPCLLSSHIQMKLGKTLELQPQEECVTLVKTLQRLESLRVMLEKNELVYSIGVGPLERIFKQLSDGVISETQATLLAQELGANDQLSLVYIRFLEVWLSSMVHTDQWRLALLRHPILLAAVEAMPPSNEARIAFWLAGISWIVIVTSALRHFGDYRLYRNAIDIGEKIIEQAASHNDQRIEGEVLHQLGVLCLDPYYARRSPANYQQEIYLWRIALMGEAAEEAGFTPKKEWWMPEPVDSLYLAEQYLRRAVAIRQGHQKGISLKALVDALNCRYTCLGDESVDVQELCSLAKQALDRLDWNLRLDLCIAVLATLLSHGDIIEPPALDQLELCLNEKYLSEYAAATSILIADTLLTQGIEILSHTRPHSALELLCNGRNFMDQLASTDAELLVRLLEREIRLIIWANIGEDIESKTPEGNVLEIAKQILRDSIESSEVPHVTCAKLLRLAFESVSRDQEDIGVVLLDWIWQLAPDLVEEHEQAFTLFRYHLLYNHGAWAANAGQAARSALAYIRSLTPLIKLGLTARMLDCLTSIEDIACKHLDLAVAQVLAVELRPIALILENMLGQSATFILQHIYKSALTVLWTDSGAEIAHTLIQMAKGASFAAIKRGYNEPIALDDEQSRLLLAQVREAEEAISEDDEVEIENDMDAFLNALLLTVYNQEQELYAGNSAGQRLANLRRSYNKHLNQVLLSHLRDKSINILDYQTILAELDEQTVLVDFYLGLSDDGKMTNYLVACTHEQVQIVVGYPLDIGSTFGFDIESTLHLQSTLIRIQHKGRKIFSHPLSLEISFLREYLNFPTPLGGEVDPKAAALLEVDFDLLFGKFVSVLETLKAAGKNHLCIVPHGPLHYYPFHLLRAKGKVLAEDWVVTYLPNLNLLISKQHLQNSAKRKQQPEHVVTSIGLSFQSGNTFNLSTLPQSITEASSVASVFGKMPLLEQDATKKRVMAALEQSRYVHISTHGKHCVEAPAFQCLYLAPDEMSDGRLFAYELLPLYLRDLEMVTLSACETALGRFDLADNLGGIPAYLLLAGVTTIVGTLWEIAPQPTEYFFNLLYQGLQEGKNRLDSFAAAQRGVREAYPKYVDWGAFYFIGDWRQ